MEKNLAAARSRHQQRLGMSKNIKYGIYKTLRHIGQRKLSLLNDAIHSQAKVSYIK